MIFVFAVGIGIGAYFLVHHFSYSYIDNVYLSEENKKEREKSYVDDLRKFVENNEISSDNTSKLSEWARDNRYVYLIIYKGNELFYTSDDPPKEEDSESGKAPEEDPDENPDEDPEEPPTDDTEKEPGEDEDGKTENEGEGKDDADNKNPGGVTIDYPTREELFEYAKKNGYHTLDDDGMMMAYLTEFTEYLYYDISNIASLVVALFLVLVIIACYFQIFTNKIIRLGNEVNKVADGDVSHVIKSKGKDEIARLSANVDNMRQSMIENFEKERAAIDANNALITSMSHDIRTPLTVLLGYIDVMQNKSGDDAEMQGYLKAAESTAMRLKKLSDDMFSYFLVFGGKELEINMENYDAVTLIDQMLFEHITLMRESGYNVEFAGLDYDRLGGAVIHTDAQKLIRIFDNVFSNIYKYADKDSSVSIKTEENDDFIAIRFSNRVSKSDNGAESNGIGLKTCKKLGEYINAGFEYNSDGAVFTACLKLKLSKNSSK